MFVNVFAILLFGIPAAFKPTAAVSITSREDVTQEVNIPIGQNLTTFCTNWDQECITLAHREGKASYVCSAGYDGTGTARVDCLAVNGGTPAPDYTAQVATALNVTFVD